MSIRTERVAGEVQQAIARLFQTEFADISDGLITITKVRMAPDLRSGKVYISALATSLRPDDLLTRIKVEAPHIRAGVARAVRLKFAPELFFYFDDTQEEVARVEEIFKKIHLKDTSIQPPSSE